MSQLFTILWDQTDRADWDKALRATPAAYQQDWAYGDVMKRAGAKLSRAAICAVDGTLLGLAQVILRPFAMIATFGLCTYGPVWLTPLSEVERHDALKAFRKSCKLRWPRLLAITPDDDTAPKGFARVMTGDATVRMDLRPDVDALRKSLDSKWRNKLSIAEKSDLRFTSSGTKPGQFQWLLDQELAQRQKRGYRGLPPEHTIAWQEEKARARGADKRAGLLVFRADIGKEPVGGMLFLIHGAMATYHIGWNSEEGRKHHAHNLILWNALLALKERGIQTLDLGGVNTGSGAGIARFKFGTGGVVHQRPGVFV